MCAHSLPTLSQQPHLFHFAYFLVFVTLLSLLVPLSPTNGHAFDKADTLGMDSHSVSFMLPSGTGEQRVDVPMRSFQGGKYSLRSSEPCELIIAQRLLPSAHRTLRSPRRAIPEVELLIFVFSPRHHSFLWYGTPQERYERTFCYLPDTNI